MLTIDRCDFFAGMGSPGRKDEKIERGGQHLERGVECKESTSCGVWSLLS